MESISKELEDTVHNLNFTSYNYLGTVGLTFMFRSELKLQLGDVVEILEVDNMYTIYNINRIQLIEDKTSFIDNVYDYLYTVESYGSYNPKFSKSFDLKTLLNKDIIVITDNIRLNELKTSNEYN